MKSILFIFVFITQAVLANECTIQIAHLNVENLHPAFMTFPDHVNEFTPIDQLPDTGVRPIAGSSNRRHPHWTNEKLKLKIQQIKAIVEKMKFKPDILGIVEVREGTVVAKLGNGLSYQEPLVSSSTNERGMDVGALVNLNENLQIISTREVPLVGPEFEWHKTRNLYVITFRVAKRFTFHFIEVHWPSQGGPTEARIHSARQTLNLVDQLLLDYPGSEAIVTGDFNTLDGEKDFRGRHPFTDILLNSRGVATLTDLFSVPQFQVTDPQPEGTYFYPPKDQWNRLDRFFVTRGLLDLNKTEGLSILPSSFGIHAPKEITTPHTRPSGEIIDIPLRYNFEAETSATAGFTDHFGIFLSLQAKWNETTAPENIFEFDKDIVLLRSVVLFPKGKTGSRRFLSWTEYEQEKPNIGISGKYANYQTKEESSFDHLKDLASKNYPFADLNYEMDREGDPDAWKGPKWESLVDALSTPEKARSVVIEIPTYRSHRPETIYQMLLRLYDLSLIKNMPLLSNIRVKPVVVTASKPVDKASAI